MITEEITECSKQKELNEAWTVVGVPSMGLYYYGARYLDPKYSRWINCDPAMNTGEYFPAAPVDDEARKHNGNLPGMGGVYNSVNLNLYHYASNNPIKYTDPDGRWGEYVHLDKTTEWAQVYGGFSIRKAEIIARACNGVDSVLGGKGPLPIIGDQSYHFNTSDMPSGGKGYTRIIHSEENLKLAISLQKSANKIRKTTTNMDICLISLIINLVQVS